MHFKVSAELPIDARTFLVERDSAAFRALVAKTQKLGALEIEDGWRDGEVQVFKLVTKPDIDRFVPKRLQSYLPGGECTYVDIIRYDPKLLEQPPFKLIVHSIPPVFKNRTEINCELTIEEVEGGKCRQTLEGEVRINIMGLGRIAEKIIGSSLHDVYSGIPEIVERWNLFRDEVLQQPNGREVLFRGRPPLQEDWVSSQVAGVMRSPYREAAGNTPTAPEASPPSQRTLNAVAATAKPLAKAMPPGAREASSNGPAPSGDAKGIEDSVPDQAAAGVAPAAPQDSGAAQPAQPHEKQSPFAGIVGRPSADSEEAVEDRRRSIAQFDGELFYEPDDIPDDIDVATADSLRSDRAEAMEWYRQHSVTGQELPSMSPVEEEPSDQGSSVEGGRRTWWRRHSRGRSLGGASDSSAGAPPLAAANAGNYPHWAAFWEKQKVAPQETAPRAATRLGHLFGAAVTMGLVKPGAKAGIKTGGKGGGKGDAAGGSADSTPVSRKKSVGFAHPVVDGVREATPGQSDDEEGDVYDSTHEKFCFCFPMPRSRH